MAALAALANPPAWAQDDGPTLPMSAVLAERLPQTPGTLVSDLAAEYPIDTPTLAQAPLPRPLQLPPAHTQWLTRPIALIADDDASRAWLIQYGDTLRDIGAAILVVRVSSPERMRDLRMRRADLPMAPAAVPELAATLARVGAAVYPLVIFPDGALAQAPTALVRAGDRR